MSIDNGVVILPIGQAVSMRFSAFKDVERQRKDPDTGFFSSIKVLSFQVIELDRQPVMTIYEVTSEKLAANLRPYLDPATLATRLFTITRTGTGYLTNYTLAVS